MEQGIPLPRRIWAVLSVSAGSVLYTLDGSIANVALPTIAHALGITASKAVILVSGYNLVLAMVLLPLAATGDRAGHRRIFTMGLVVYIISAVACFFAGSFWLLVAARALQAFAAASVLSVSLAMVRTIYPSHLLGRGLGLNTMASTLGAAIAPPLGGIVIATLSWHWVFALGAPLAVLALCCVRHLPDPELREEPYDKTGAILCALTFGLLVFGCQALSGLLSPVLAVATVCTGILTAILFVRHERNVSLPVLPVDLLARPALALSVMSALLAVLSSTEILLYIPFRLSALGLSTAAIGAMIAPYAIAVMLTAPSSGMLSDRVSPNVLGTAGLLMALISALALAWIPDHPSYGDIAWRTALCGVGFSMFFSPNGRLVVGSVPRHRAAGASSLISTTRMFGQALGSTILGALLALHLPPSAPGYVAAVLAAGALLCSALRMVVRPADSQMQDVAVGA
ncbi:MAG TPA: MFS transporter [Sphingobium sp.]|uniref:MFS transporter n=1 Tax=Sphingobium sp. TaxID=1912891 RepID=UPI002ED408E9